jgi:anti-sigma B factor antagonist
VTVEPLGDDDGVRVLRAAGELDVAVVPQLLGSVPDLVAGVDAVVLDLSGVSFFDSSGVRLLDRLVRECARVGVALRVVAPPAGTARGVLEIVGMAGPLVADDLASAVTAVRAAR